VDSQLECPEALVSEAQRRLGALRGRPLLSRRGVRGQAHQLSAEELGDRLPGCLPGEIPERRLERPVTARVERDRLEDGDVALDGERIRAYEEVLVALEAVHRVSRA